MKLIKEYLLPLAVATSLIVLFQTFLFEPFNVDGYSMYPTLEDGDRMLINKMEEEYSHEDIIVFKRHINDHLVKRVIGVEGDKIQIVNGAVYRNKELLKETYIETSDPAFDYLNEVTVPQGYLFVMGDNRKYSSDSREIGFINTYSVVGKVDYLFWPFDKIGALQ